MSFTYSGTCARCGATDSATFTTRLGPAVALHDSYDTECQVWEPGASNRCNGNVFMTLEKPDED